MDFKRSSWKKVCTSVFFTLTILALITAPVLAAATTPIFRSKWGTSGSADGSFSQPIAIEATATQVYVADSINNRIQIFTRDGDFVSKIGPNFDGDGGVPLRVPQGVAVDSAGNIYVSDTYDRVLKFNASLVFQAKTTAATGLFSPSGLAVSPDGATLFVADTFNNRIVKLNTSDMTVATGSPIGTGLSVPKDVAINTAGTHIFVADTGNNRLVKIPVGGGTQNNSTVSLNQPNGIAIDTADNIYVANTNGNILLKLTSTMATNKSWGSVGSANGQVQYPKGIAALSEDLVYVADTNNNRVQYFEPNAPIDDLVLSSSSILEGNTVGQTVGTFSAQDPNTMDVFQYEWVTIANETCDNGTYFNLSGANLTAKQVFDFETKSTYGVCVKVWDSNRQNFRQEAFPIIIIDGSDAPQFVSPPTSISINEYSARSGNNIVPNLTVATLTITDNDVVDDFQYSIGGGTFAQAFQLVKDATDKKKAYLKIYDNGATPPAYQTLLDFETAPQLTPTTRGGTVLLRVEDDAPGDPDRITDWEVNIVLANQPDPPIINFPAQPFQVDELAPVDTVVGPAGVDCTPATPPAACLITLTDQDTAFGSLTLSSDPTHFSDYFKVVKVASTTASLWKVVTKAPLPDHFTFPNIDFYLRAYDNTNYSWRTLSIANTDSNNAPVLLQDYEMHSDRGVGYVLALATDVDINDTLSYQILSGNTGDTFGIVDGKIQIVNDALIDYDYWQTQTPKYFELEVSVSDDADPPLTDGPRIVRIHITEGNRPPKLDPAYTVNLTTPEHTTGSPLGANVVGTIKFIDPDNDPEFSNLTITSPIDGPFVVDDICQAPCVTNVTVNTSKLSQIDYETAPGHALSITVTVTDSVPGSVPVTQTFPVTITNINEPITIDNEATPITVHDRWAAGYVVGTVAWTDQDGNANTHPIFTLSGMGEEHFGINQSTGEIYILPTANLHYYERPSFTPLIQVWDEVGGFTDYTPFTINLIDDNDPPTFKVFEYANAPTNTLPENQPNGTVVGSFVVFDENGQDFTVTIDGGNGAYSISTAAMDPVVANGKTMIHKRVTVTIADTTKIDYDTALNHQAPITLKGVEIATTPLTGTKTYDINLGNINEQPQIANQQLYTYQDVAPDVIVGTLAASDPDSPTTLTYETVSGGTAGTFFQVNATTGVVSVKQRSSPTLNPGTYTMTVRVRDNGQPVLTSTNATITITVTSKADPTITLLKVPASELLIGSAVRYDVTVKNIAAGMSSTYKLYLKLPTGVGFVSAGSTTGCTLKFVDTVECPGALLQPAGTAGDTANFVINAHLYSSTTRDISLNSHASLELTATLNDLNPNNNTKDVAFTTRKSIVITNQTFESAAPLDFTLGGNPATKTTAPACVTNPQSFAGLYSNDTLQYSKAIIAHNKVEVSFDLYLPYTWDGNGSDGPDRWKFCKGNCQTAGDFFLDTTFSNLDDMDKVDNVPMHPQFYPGTFGSTTQYPAFTSSVSRNTLGFHTGINAQDPCAGDALDSVYTLRYEFEHTDPTLIFKFIAEGLQAGLKEEKWGIDNFKVTIFGENSYGVFLPSLRR